MSGEKKTDNTAVPNNIESKGANDAGNAGGNLEEKEKREVKPESKKLAHEKDSEQINEMMKKGLTDFKNVFLYPLLTGVMTGVGFIAGKKLAEAYFYPQGTNVVLTAPKTS